MVALGQVYAAIAIVLLLVALAVAIPVLKQMVVDGIERRRKWKSGEMERYGEDEEYDRGPPSVLDGEREGESRLTCRHCGAENDPEFAHCRKCAKPL